MNSRTTQSKEISGTIVSDSGATLWSKEETTNSDVFDQHTTELSDERESAQDNADRLPRLRRELQLLESNHSNDRGTSDSPKWVLHDPIRSKYFQLGWVEFELLSRWSLGSRQQVLERTNSKTTLNATDTHIGSLINLLLDNELIEVSDKSDLQTLLSHTESRKKVWWKSAFTMSMFCKRSLINPDRILGKLNGKLSRVYDNSKLLLYLWAAVASVLSVALMAHAHEFRSMFSEFMSPTGLVLFALTLILTNIVHEFGHGLMAKKYDCRVTEMGIAFIFAFPVAYCDTTSAWQLSSTKQRMVINSGGILLELVLATVAAALWLVLPDGLPRVLAFFVAVSSLGTTLLINLNPFMKFDGYYLLADSLRIENLQQKSFENFRWQIRRWLIGSTDSAPFAVSPKIHRIQCTYAAGTWIYRTFLYFAIAWMVYEFWFKALGLLLMGGVVVSMLIKPVVRELQVYQSQIKRNRTSVNSLVTVFVVALAVLLILVPLPRKIVAPAVIGAADTNRYYAPQTSKISEIFVVRGQKVQAGELLIVLHDPELEFQLETLEMELLSLRTRRNREIAMPSLESHQQVSEIEVLAKEQVILQLERKIESLSVVAKESGSVVGIPDWLAPDVWIKTNTLLAEVVSLDAMEVRAYLSAETQGRVKHESAYFYPNSDSARVSLELTSLPSADIETLSDTALAVPNGGDIAVHQGADGELIPIRAWHMSLLRVTDKDVIFANELPGYVLFQAYPRSLAVSAFNRVVGTVIRESGF